MANSDVKMQILKSDFGFLKFFFYSISTIMYDFLVEKYDERAIT